jgi:hypothetical protein
MKKLRQEWSTRMNAAGQVNKIHNPMEGAL